MPVYEYACENCGETSERVDSVEESKREIFCPVCRNGKAHRIISHNFSFSQFPSWINDNLRSSIQDESEKPIESRSELNKVAKEKGLVENPKRK